jgi:hypothetical protein
MSLGSTLVTSNLKKNLSLWFLVLFTIIRYNVYMEYGRKLRIYLSFDSLYSTNLLSSMLIEILILLIQPYPNINDF